MVQAGRDLSKIEKLTLTHCGQQGSSCASQNLLGCMDRERRWSPVS